MSDALIYALLDPRDQSVRYIGKTVKTLKYRLQQHLSDCKIKRDHRACWLKHLVALGLKPSIFLLEETLSDHWQEAERFWIAFFRSKGSRLTNSTNGGEDQKEPTPATRARMSAAHKGNMPWNKGKPSSPEEAKRLADMGRNMSEETRAKMAEANRRKWEDPVIREKIIASKKGKPSPKKGSKASPETIAKMSKAMKGKPGYWTGKKRDTVTCAKISAALKGKTGNRKGQSPGVETRAKISATLKARYRASSAASQLPIDL